MLIRYRITLDFLDKGFNEILGLTRTRAAACEWQLAGTQKVTCPRTGLAALFWLPPMSQRALNIFERTFGQ